MKWLVMLAIGLSLANSQDRFDLVCEGTFHQAQVGQPVPLNQQGQAFERTYRVDLESRRYCVGDCSETRSIYSIDNYTIWFQRSEGNDEVLWRSTGALTYITERGPLITAHVGNCERAPFTGFPGNR